MLLLEEEDNKLSILGTSSLTSLVVFLSDHFSNTILILNSEFEFIHKISVRNPMGITMDREDRIIVVCVSDNNCLQIF